jgi:hypothetical protein
VKAALLLAALAACGCGGRKEGPEGAGRADKEGPVPGEAKGEGERWLVLESHDSKAELASYAAIDLAAARPSPVALGTAPALPDTSWPGHYRTVAAHAGPRWVHGEAVSGGFRLVLGDARGGAPRSIEVDGEPTALYIHREALFVGLGRRLGWFDLAAGKPVFGELVAREHQFKAYDLFARSGDRLVAVDDVVMPMFADWFDVSGKAPRRVADWSLPGVINGHYTHAALHPAAGGDFTLYLLAPYGIMDGDGHDLVAVPVRGDKLVFEEGLTLQNGKNGPTPVIEEHVSRDSGKTFGLVAGSEATDWTGLAVDPASGRLLIAAGTRGLIVLPGDFTSTSKGTLVELGAPCRDVAVRGGLLVALVGDDKKSELVILTGAGDSYAAGVRHPLPAAFDRFLD